MDKIISLFGKKVILAIAGMSIVAGGVYVGVGRQGAVPVAPETTLGNANAPTPTRSDSGYVETQWTQGRGAAGMPENWPSDAPPAYHGAMLISSQSKDLGTGKPGPSVNYFTGASETEVIDYYVKGLTANAWKIEANADSPAGYRVITAKKDTRSFFAFISIVQMEGKTGVTSGITF